MISFSSSRLRNILFPVLLAALYQDDDTRAIMEEDISMKFLSSYAKQILEKGGEEEKEEVVVVGKRCVDDFESSKRSLFDWFPKKYLVSIVEMLE